MRIRDEIFQDILFEEKAGKDSLGKARFVWCMADSKNLNGRIYPKKILEAEVKRLQGVIDMGDDVWGSDGHPEGSAHLKKVGDISHRLTRVWMEGDKAMGEAEIIGTTIGKNLAVVLRHGKLGVSLRGTGRTVPEDGGEVVGDDFRCSGIDFVMSPSFVEAQAGGLFESAEFPAERKAEAEMTEEQEGKALSEEFFSCRRAIEDAVRFGFDEGAWVKDFSPDLAIVRTVEYDQASGETREALVQIPYKIGDGGEVTLDLENVERVREQTVFTPVAEQGPEETRFGKLSNEEMRLSGAKENFGPETKLNLTKDEERYLSPAEAKRYRDEKFKKPR